MSYVVISRMNSAAFLSRGGYWGPYAEAAVSASLTEALESIDRVIRGYREAACVTDIADLDELGLLLDCFNQAVGDYTDSDGNTLYLDNEVMEVIAASMARYVQVRQPFELTEATPTLNVDIAAVRALATSPDGPLMARVNAEVWLACCDAIAATASPDPEPEPRSDFVPVSGYYASLPGTWTFRETG